MAFLRNVFVAVFCVILSSPAWSGLTPTVNVKIPEKTSGIVIKTTNLKNNQTKTTNSNGLAYFEGECKKGLWLDQVKVCAEFKGYQKTCGTFKGCAVELRMQKEKAKPATSAADNSAKAPTKKDCGNVGQKECGGEYFVCKADADCTAAKKTLPSNATAGHCWARSGKGYSVCTATKCKGGYDVSNGHCIEKKATSAPAETPVETPTPTAPVTDDKPGVPDETPVATGPVVDDSQGGGTSGGASSNATGGCTLEFKSNGDRLTKLEHITDAHQVGRCVRPGIECTEVNWSNAGWWTYVDDYEVDGEEPMAKLDSEDDSPFLNDLIKVDGVDVDLVSVFENSADIYFACDKRYRDNYFAIRDCVEGYHGENVLLVGDDGIEYYEKCVKDEGPLDDTELGDNTTVDENSGDESSGDNDTEETPAPNVNVDNSKDIADAESAYSNAKANEQSLANRLLGGASMAATGIGGMQLAQGLAEQSADAAAEADMQAYLATFTCKIGDAGGKSYKGGEMGIEVSGGNQLTSLYQQYVDLAADLKERKNALGMAPGIESTVVMDKANMGLYDDTGRGIENGTYASLYRASRGNEADQQKLAEQKDTSSTRVKAGAIAAGVGAIGGAIGNAIINSGDDDDETVTEADCKKVKGTYKDGKCTCPGKDKVYKKGKCVDKSDNKSGLAELGVSLGSSLGSNIDIGNAASMASGLMSGSGQ